FGSKSRIGRAAERPARVLVGAGAPLSDDVPSMVDSPPPPNKTGEIFGRVAVGLNVVALLLHLGALVTRGIAADRMPWGNMYEYILSATFVGSAVWVGVLFRRPAIRHIGLFVSLALVLLLGADGMIAYVPVGPLVPALHSYWFIIHVSTIILASGIFL